MYRILFLLFAEQRGMMPGRDSLYAETYSIAALRAHAEERLAHGATDGDRFSHTDLWEGLKVTFRLVREGAPALGVFGYNGMLFAGNQTPLLEELGRGIRNSDLLRAIRSLTLIEREGVLQRISYADLGVEELGSIYESLLDFTPRVTREREVLDEREIPAHTFFLDPRGSERKTSGSYYTHDSLVDELIKSALLPVARDRLAGSGLPVIEEEAIGEASGGLLTDYAALTEAQRDAGVTALLDLKLCDPAAGSGHFLVKANNVLGAELARIRTGDAYPTEAQIQAAKRDVLTHCIYAVDLNPMAVELCKVSLWINASVGDRPLSFLDHHITCGNSLIGTMVRPGSPQAPNVMAEGVPYEAFDHTLVGNDRKRAVAIRKRNRQERRDFEEGGGFQPSLFRVTVLEPGGAVWQHYQYVTAMAEERPQAALERYEDYLNADEVRREKLVADAWTAAFFWPIDEHTTWAPTYGEFLRLRDEGPEAIPLEAADGTHPVEKINALAERYNFFHWHLAFPDVFEHEHEGHEVSRNSPISSPSRSGFDVVLGNPPWERIKLQEKEFFVGKSPAIANARTASARRKLIKQLPQTDPELHAAYVDALRESEASSHFLRESGRYPLSAVGDINTYQVFAGLVRQIVGPAGRVGVVVPSGIATDYYNQDYFRTIVDERELVSFYDFENRGGLFPEVHRSYKFCLLTLTGGEAEEAEFAFFLHTTDDLADPERRFALSPDEIALLNPNTGTVPIFRTRRDAELTKKLYRAAPVLVNEETGENPWGVSFLRMFDMANDSGLFHTREELEAQGFVLEGHRFVRGDEVYLQLYEAKMFHQFNHRYGTFQDVDSRTNVHLSNPAFTEYQNPDFLIHPWYWVMEKLVNERIGKSSCLLSYRRVVRVTDERTGIFCMLPPHGAGDSVFILRSCESAFRQAALLASLNSLAFDFVARQKVGGINFSFFITKQLPILPPNRYTPALLDFIVPRVVELSYTAWDLQPFARDVLDEVGPERWARWFAGAAVHTSPPPAWAKAAPPPPFIWDEDRRAVLRAELDAVYAHLYGLTRDELAYILDTFPIVKRKDEAKYGEYRTKRMVLEAFESLRPLTE